MRVIEARIQARYLRDDKVTRVEDRCQEFTCIVVRRYYIFQIVIYTGISTILRLSLHVLIQLQIFVPFVKIDR